MKKSDRSSSETEICLERKTEVTFEEAFELTGNGRFNHLVLLTCGLILLNVSMESVGMSYVITAAECDLQLTSAHKGFVNAAVFIGIITTSFLWGYLSDRMGRRAVMLPAILCSAMVSIISSFSINVWMLLALRVLAGCLVSASSATVYAYLGEMNTTSRRSAAIAWGSAFISFSFIILPGLAWLIIPGKWSLSLGSITMVPWRAFMCLWCVPGILAAVILFALPESPRYLLSAKGPAAALPVLAKMYAWNFQKKIEDFPVEKITMSSVSDSVKDGFVGALQNFSLLFRPPLLRCGLIANMSMFTVFLLSSGLYLWVPDILNNILQSTSKESISICEIIHNKFQRARNESLFSDGACKTEVSIGVFPISMAMGAVFALVYLAIGFLINRVGRKTLYCSIMVTCGAATIASGFVPQGAAATALLILALCSGCAGSILPAISVDVFPTSMRAMAMCVMYMVGRLGAAVGSYILGTTLDRYCIYSFTGFGAYTIGSFTLMLFWPNHQKVREEMERKGLTY